MKRPITDCMDIFYVFALTTNFASWGGYQTLSAKALGLFACLYVVNEWLTSRSSHDIYTPVVFVNDLVVGFIVLNLPSTLSSSASQYGYSPYFWLSIGAIEILYAVWAIAISQITATQSAKRNLSWWSLISLLTAALAWSTFAYQRFGRSLIVGHGLAGATTLFIVVITIKWNWDRYKRHRHEGVNFLD